MPGSRRVAACLAVLLAPVLLGGCILHALFGNARLIDPQAHLPTLEAAIQGGATTAICSRASAPGDPDWRCDYIVSGVILRSTANVNAESATSFLVDPVIVQVPANARGFVATFAGAAAGNIAITELVGGFDADSSTHVNPEPNHRFVVLDFPASVSPAGGQDYSFELTFEQDGSLSPVPVKATPVRVKAMFAGKVTVGGKTFYPPLLPCVSDFAAIPAMTLPEAASPQPIAIPTSGVQGCNAKVYSFFFSPLATTEVVEFYHAGLDHYFITWLADEAAALDQGTQIRGWTRTGRTFKAYPAAETGTTPVCRYYLPPAFGNSHFYGRGTAECDATGQQHPQFVLESSAFMHLRLPDVGTCLPGARPVYRVFSNRADANHRYMTDRALRDQMVAAGWLAEGDGPDRVVMCAPS